MSLIRRMNLPNRLTLMRIALVPLFCVFLSVDAVWAQIAAAAVFVAASLTDMLDGRIARKRGLITDFGKLMDPIADKLLVTAAMVFLTAQARMAPGVCTAFIAREFIISGFRLVAAARDVVIAAGTLGKYKTATQMVGIVMCVLCLPTADMPAVIAWPSLGWIARAVIWAALCLSIVSCVEYLYKNRGVIDTREI